jgi:hypothetical protein
MGQRGRPRKSHLWAEAVLRVVEEHPGGLTMKRILALTGLTPSQYRAAYNWTLDTFGEPFWARTYVGGEGIYMTTENRHACAEDWQRTISTQITRARREFHKAHAFAEAHPSLMTEEQELLAKHRLESLRLAKRKLNDE